MSFDHVAITTRDLPATHCFYTEAVGFSLVRVDVLNTPDGGWMRHAFYDTGNGALLAVIEFHDPSMADYRTDISTGLGLPSWANHLAFSAHDLDELDAHRDRLLDHGHPCAVMDHGSAIALYADDPNGIMIEFTTRVRPVFTDADRRRAEALIHERSPKVDQVEPVMELFAPSEPRRTSDIVENARVLVNA